MSDRDRRLADLFAQAVALPTEAREAFAADHCGDDPGLAAELRTLLRHDEPHTPSHLQPPLGARSAPERIGAYRLVRSLGTGGMGEVFLAQQEEPVRRAVAVKLIRAGMDSADVVARFAAERQVLAWLDHPHIAKVLDAGSTLDGRPYFVMEFVDGATLTTYCRARHLDLDARLRLFAMVCRGVQHAHQRGVIHRDLKPSNVLVSRVDGQPVPKIIDFGVAKAVGDERLRTPVTLAGQLMGTPEYMSPEQLVADAPPDVRSDVYSLGVILYELLAGRRPLPAIPGESVPHLLQRLAEHEPVPPSAVPTPGTGTQHTRRVRGELDWIAARALAKEPRRRYQSVQELLADVEAFFAGAPVAAGPPTMSYRLSKMLRRHKAAVGAIVAVMLALVVGLCLALWQASIAAQQAARAEQNLTQIQRLSDERLADALFELARRKLWPITPAHRDSLRHWLDRCAELEHRLPQHREELAAVSTQLDGASSEGEAAYEEPSRIDDLTDPQRDTLRWRRAVLTRLVEGTERLLDDEARYGRRDVRARLAQVESLIATQASADTAWAHTLHALGDRAASPAYADDTLARRQTDLVPLGQNQRTGLFEFWHVPSGACPEWTETDGVTTLRADDGVVLVLLPGGRFAMGAEPSPDAVNSDSLAHAFETPVHDVELAPFFLSKFELTQAQVQRWTGQNPSWFAAERAQGKRPRATVTPTNPVEQVSWEGADTLVRQMGLELPTEAQWEYACRAGTRTRFFWGDDEARFGDFANIADEASRSFFKAGTELAMGIDDGQGVHAPVGSYAPNAFGVYDMIGNVGEWCRDWAGPYSFPVAPKTGERRAESDGRRTRIIRGGTFVLAPRDCRCSTRGDGVIRENKWSVGVRPGRAVEE